MLRTKRFGGIMDRLGKRRISKPGAWFLLYLMPVAAAIAFYLFAIPLSSLLSPRGPEIASYIRTLGPLSNLGLPGINPYIPVVDGWIALFAAIIVHEGAHGVVARSLGLPVKSAGLLFFLFVPIGAFVEVDEDALKVAKGRDAGRVLAAGAGINFIAGLLCLLILVSLVGAMSPATTGAGIVSVAPGSPAATRGLLVGDIITAVDGHAVTDLNTVLGENTTLKAGQSVNLTVYRNGATIFIDKVQLACCNKLIDVRTNQTLAEWPYIGVAQVTYSQLQSNVAQYSRPLENLGLYFCPPTLTLCEERVPFSDVLAKMYTSSLGLVGAPLANLLYWLFFLNFSISIFNSLPIYPLDGGQTFRVALNGLARGRVGEKSLGRITSVVSLAVLAMLLGVIVGPYLLAL